MVPALLRDRVFRRYWSGSTISMFGDQISGVALPLAAVLALHVGAAQMGYLTALEWLPSLLFGLPAGAWVDRRGRRRRTMIAADLGRAALFASIPVTYALHALTLAQLFAVTFGAGVLSIGFNVSDATLFVSIVAPDRYLDGQSLVYGSRALSFVGGPSIGGLLVQALSAPFAVAADALSFLGSAFFLGRIRPAEPPADSSGGSALAGARFIAGSALVRASLIAVATINFFNLMFAALYLLYAVRVLHIRPGLVGVLIGMAAVGGLLGALVTKRIAARIGVGWAYAAGCLLFTAPLVLWPLAHGSISLILLMLFAAEFVSGFGVMMLDISIGTIFAAVIPDTAQVPGDRRVPGGQLRHPAARRAARRAAGQRAGAAARAVGGDHRRHGRVRAAAAHAAAALPATRGGRSGAGLSRPRRRAGRPGSSSRRSPG